MKVVPGALVDFYSEGRIIAGIVLCEEKGRLRIETEAGREDRIAPARVLAAYEGNPRLAILPGKPEPAKLQAAHKLAAEHARAARDRTEPLDLELVWEVVVDEGGERTLEELTELATGERSTIACAAMLRALLEEKVHFTRRADLWESRSREAVAEIVKQKETEKRRAAERERFLERARLSLKEGAPFQPTGEESETRWLAALEELAVQGSAAVDPRETMALLSDLGVRADTPDEGAFRVLRALGVFSEHENLFIRRYGLQVEFPVGAETIARHAVESALGAAGGATIAAGAAGARSVAIPAGLAAEIDAGARRDLTGLELFSVDDEMTSEIDDALSVEPGTGGRHRVGIHIADPGFLIPPGSDLDTIAQARAVTFYLPERRVLMLPAIVSERAASLVPDEPRAALSFFADLDEKGALLSWEIVPSVISSSARVTYEDASEAVRNASEPSASIPRRLRALHRLAMALEAARVANGAHLIRAPEVDLSVGPDGAISLKRMESDDPGRVLVSEMMILASRISAGFCLERNVPCIYRRQAPAEEPYPSVTGGTYDPVAVRKARRGMRRSETGLVPGRHYALGLDAYAQSTSPIRRYQDLVIHRQIKSVLAGAQPCYDAEALQRIAALTDEAERIARLAERGSDEYWTLVYLGTKIGQEVEGVIVYKDRRRVEAELSETLYSVAIAPRPDQELGQVLRFVVESVNPRGPSILLRQIGPAA